MEAKESAGKEKTSPRPGAGGFRETEIGPLLKPSSTREEKAKAAKMLRARFKNYHTVAGVARAEGVDRSTIERWIKRIVEAGIEDPRGTTTDA